MLTKPTSHLQPHHLRLKLWDISEEELYSIAMNNERYNVKPMRQVVAEIMGIDCSEIEIPEDNALYVLRSETHNRGAAGIFDMEFLKRTAEQFQMKAFYILPSSIFEIILISEEDAPEKEVLKEMVAEVNNTQVKEEEFLSNNIYYYNTETDDVVIVKID